MSTAFTRLAAVVAAGALALGGASLAFAHACAEPEHDVEIDDFAFHPARYVARPGELVVWKNSDRAPHNATSFATRRGKPVFATRTGGKGARLVARAPARAGTYRYFCSVHPRMRGVLVVRR